MDKAYKQTMKLLKRLEKQLNKIFKDIFKGIDELDVDAFVDILLSANQQAVNIVNKHMYVIYDINHKWVAEQLTSIRAAPNTVIKKSMSKYDRRAYNRLLAQGRLTKAIEKAINDGLKLGEGVPKIAKRIQKVSNKSRNSAILTARTETTRVMNMSRHEGYKKAESLGIKLKKRWVATEDGRTRDSHRHLDGEIREIDEPFSNGGIEPGDASLPASERCGCRCTTVPEVIK